MLETWGVTVTAIGLAVVIVGLFVRIEHRLTKVETLIMVVAGRLGICQPPLGKDTQ